MIVAKHVRYSGRVQGVGFRYTAQHLAAGYAVAGYVRNLPNGDVELVVEGESDQVEGFLGAVASAMAAHIGQKRVTDEPPAGRTGFLVRY